MMLNYRHFKLSNNFFIKEIPAYDYWIYLLVTKQCAFVKKGVKFTGKMEE
jgi:hypothetical protein